WETQTDGSLLLEGIQSGNHHLRVTKDGFNDWENSIFCDGKPQQVMAELSSKSLNPNQTMKVPQPTMPPMSQIEQETVVSQQKMPVNFQQSYNPPIESRKKGFSMLLLFGGIGAFLLLGVFGIGIYWVFFSSGLGFGGNTNLPVNHA